MSRLNCPQKALLASIAIAIFFAIGAATDVCDAAPPDCPSGSHRSGEACVKDAPPHEYAWRDDLGAGSLARIKTINFTEIKDAISEAVLPTVCNIVAPVTLGACSSIALGTEISAAQINDCRSAIRQLYTAKAYPSLTGNTVWGTAVSGDTIRRSHIQDMRNALNDLRVTCTSLVCNYNGIPDNGETGTDCGGGGCPACPPVCNFNGIPDNGETGTDCGGGGCGVCGNCGYGTCYACSPNCTIDISGFYSESTCSGSCPPSGPCGSATCYKCSGTSCIQDDAGGFFSEGTCAGSCGACVPDCTGKNCGFDGCSGSCGSCSGADVCVLGNCTPCVPNCAGRSCGSDGCSGSCGTCGGGDICNGLGQCVTCSCNPAIASTVCVGQTFSDSCGNPGSCPGTMSGTCSPATAATVCTGSTFADSCGAPGACSGAKDCSACSCNPATAASTCLGQTFADSCGAAGVCAGTMSGSCNPATAASTCVGQTFADSCGAPGACSGTMPATNAVLSGWGACQADCTHSRSVITPASCGGSTDTLSESCTGGACGACTPVNGGWSGWSGCIGFPTETRSCDSPAPSCGGTPCSGPSSQACPVRYWEQDVQHCCWEAICSGTCGCDNYYTTYPDSSGCVVGTGVCAAYTTACRPVY